MIKSDKQENRKRGHLHSGGSESVGTVEDQVVTNPDDDEINTDGGHLPYGSTREEKKKLELASKEWRRGMIGDMESYLATLGFDTMTYLMANIHLEKPGLARPMLIQLDEDGFLSLTTRYDIEELGAGNDMTDITQTLATLNREARVCEFWLSSPSTVTAEAHINNDGDEHDLQEVMERWEYDTNELWKQLTH